MKSPPPLLLGTAILFWGWQSQLLIIALLMAIILESTHWVKWRIVFDDKDFNRLADLSTLLLVSTFIYLFSQQSIQGLFTFLNWLPMLFFLLLTAQRYSHQGTIRLSSLFISLRKLEGKKGIPLSERLDMSYSYLLISLLSTSVHKSSWFFPSVSLLVIWGLWAIRPRRYSLTAWLLLISCAITLAFFEQWSLYRLQTEMEEMFINWLQWRYRDPYKQETAIGDIGRLKQSEKIILRVSSPQPLLLRETVYNSYFKTVWRAKQTTFRPLHSQNGITWLFANPSNSTQQTTTVQVARYLQRGEGLLALPQETFLVSDLPVGEVQFNELGTVKVSEGADLITYTARFRQDTQVDTPPTAQDLLLPPDEETFFKNLAHHLGLLSQTPTDVVHTLTTFFTKNFQYSLDLNRLSTQLTPLADFLYQHRSGHCEYFATSTVLLLRAAGIPARYASGYAVEEFSALENLYLVRARHAHAWVLAYVNGHWQEVDTTPATWFEIETEQAPWWQSFYDIIAWANYQFVKWRYSDTKMSQQWLIGLLLPLILLLVWRLYKKEKVKNWRQAVRSTQLDHIYPFYQVVQRLHTTGYTRTTGETLLQWFERLPLSDTLQSQIREMLTLHQRQRFDPLGLSIPEYEKLKAQVKHWLDSFERDATPT